MRAPVHFEVEVFYETKVGPACGYDAPGDLTDDHAKVTCVECRKLCGFRVPYSPVRFDVDPESGRERFAA